MIDKINNRNNNSNSINNKISNVILKEIENHFCKNISANNKYNLTNQTIPNNKKENKDKDKKNANDYIDPKTLILTTSM